MNQDYKIYVDAGWPATLNDGAGILTDCANCKKLYWLGSNWRLSRRYERP